MKEIIRDKKVDFRVTEQEKEIIQAYAKQNGMKVSEVIRYFLEPLFQKEEN